MTTYAVAHLREIDFGAAIIAYLERIDATLAPFGGHYIVHGGTKTVLEGTWPGDIVILAFPDRAAAEAWYASPAYQEILAFRTDNSAGDVILIDGVEPGHRAIDLVPRQTPRQTG